MTDWSFPALTQTWANFLAALKGRDESNAKMDYSADSNIPDGTIRWSAPNSRFEIWNATALTWTELTIKASGNTIWHGGNDGSGSGLDADTVDGVGLPNAIASVLTDHNKAAHDALNIDAATLDSLTSSQFLRSDTSDSMSGSLTLTGATLPAVGSVAAPAHSFSGDSNSGVYSAASGDVRIVSNGAWRFQVFGTLVQVNDGSTRTVWHSGNTEKPIGEGQNWQDVSASRVGGTTYTNSTGQSIMFSVLRGEAAGVTLTVGGVIVADVQGNNSGDKVTATAIVPNGATYSANAFSTWLELR